jgi:hypothetical protein
MNIDKNCLEACGITKSPLDAYRGSGRHSKLPKTKPLFSNIHLIRPLTFDTKHHFKDFPNTVILEINK